MKRINTLLIAFGSFLLPAVVPAQDLAFNTATPVENSCVRVSNETPSAAKSTSSAKAAWSKEEDLVNGSISKTKLNNMKGVASALVDFLKDACLTDGGYNPTWHGEYFSGKNSPGPMLKFGVTCHFAEQNADLSITANDIQPLLDQLVVNGRHYATIRVATAVSGNAFYYNDPTAADGSAQTKMWLVTAGKGRLPFTPVTRREYLEEAKAELTAMIDGIEAGWKMKVPVRAAEVQEAEKKAVIEQLKTMYSGTELEVRTRIYLRNYKTDEQLQQQHIEEDASGLKATVQLMDNLMNHMSAAEQSKPAIVSVTAADFHGFEDGQTDYMLVRLNDAYFNNGLSEEKPQVFLVTWHYDPTNPSTVGLDKQLTAHLDSQKLSGLLGK